MIKQGKCLVVGSNSFSGSSFVCHLLRHNYSVVGCSRSPEPQEQFLPYRWDAVTSAFTFYQFDVNHDLDSLMDMIEREEPAYVVNFAAQSMVAQSWDHPDHWFTTNVVSMVGFHDALRHCKFLKKYVHISTPEVYGSTSGVIDETERFNPSTPYAVSRAAADMSLKCFHSAYQFPVVITRAANVFGPGQQLYRIIPRTVLFIKLGRKLQLHGGGLSERSFIHIDDVCEATERIMRDGTLGETYHISTSRIISIRSLVEMICARMQVDFESCVEMVDERLGKDANYSLDSSKLQHSLGWSDKVSLERGIDETIEWVERWQSELELSNFDYVHKA